MIDTLFSLLQKPELWQRSSEPFWDDEHISKGMLEAHLNPDWDAASRKHSFIARSVKWLSSLIPANGRILDIGCGPGLYTKQLSERGYDVTGMDISRRSIEYAKSQDTETTYLLQNYLTLDYNRVFDVVTMIYCDYAALTPDERKTLVGKVYSALKPGGIFILDVFTEKYVSKAPEKATWTLYDNGSFWSADTHICLEASYLFKDDMAAVNQYIIVTKNGIKEYLVWDTAFTVEKLAEEVSPFTVKSVYDDVCGSSYSGKAKTLCVVLERGADIEKM